MYVIHKRSDVVKMYGLENQERLYEGVAHIRSEQAQVTKTKLMDVLHQRLGLANE